MDARIDSPELINQSALSVCGPAAIIYLLVSRNPSRFVDLGKQLYETGTAALDGEVLSADSDLRQNKPPKGMAQVDWMLLSSIRDSENAVLDYEGTPKEQFSGITTPGEMTGLMKSILKCKEAEWHSSYLTSELRVIKQAGLAVGLGRKAVLLIDQDMLSGAPKKTFGYPNHWVVLRSLVEVTQANSGNERIKFDAWTWGEAPKSLDLDKNAFVSMFFGAAICG